MTDTVREEFEAYIKEIIVSEAGENQALERDELGVYCATWVRLSWQSYQAGRESMREEAWQPIETAPRGSGEDGPRFVNHPDYVKPPKILLWTEEGPMVGYYDWYYHEGYGRGAEPGISAWRDHNGERTYGASHWMPLPAAPSSIKELP